MPRAALARRCLSSRRRHHGAPRRRRPSPWSVGASLRCGLRCALRHAVRAAFWPCAAGRDGVVGGWRRGRLGGWHTCLGGWHGDDPLMRLTPQWLHPRCPLPRGRRSGGSCCRRTSNWRPGTARRGVGRKVAAAPVVTAPVVAAPVVPAARVQDSAAVEEAAAAASAARAPRAAGRGVGEVHAAAPLRLLWGGCPSGGQAPERGDLCLRAGLPSLPSRPPVHAHPHARGSSDIAPAMPWYRRRRPWGRARCFQLHHLRRHVPRRIVTRMDPPRRARAEGWRWRWRPSTRRSRRGRC